MAGQRVVDQKIRQVHQLADSAAAVKFAVVHGGNAGAVVAAIFETAQRLDQSGCNFVLTQNANDTAHSLHHFCQGEMGRNAHSTARP